MPQTPAADPRPTSRWRRLHVRLHRNRLTSAVTTVVVSLVGGSVLLAGLVMMVTPGPGLVGIAAGLAILATEWDWAARWLAAARRRLDKASSGAFGSDPRTRARRQKLVGGAGVAALLASLAVLVLAPDLLG